MNTWHFQKNPKDRKQLFRWIREGKTNQEIIKLFDRRSPAIGIANSTINEWRKKWEQCSRTRPVRARKQNASQPLAA